ncbi:N-acetyltransferase [Streptomyces sp. NPDC059788]|uniref:N-acetyltransferase n=1 Tax=Streptomyces sp. NPDC059788 TaxID=3346948 RepID=UPI00364AB135
MSKPPFVPDDFTVPRELVTDRFRLEPLAPGHNLADHTAWTSSITHIRATPGFAGRGWPPAAGMTPEENLGDLRQHARDFERRTGFTYSVIGIPDDEVVGCVYIYPERDGHSETGKDSDVSGPEHAEGTRGAPVAEVRSWVRADRAELDGPLYAAVRDWLAGDWPFETVRYAARDL